MSKSLDRLIVLLWVLVTPMMAVSIYMIFLYAPEEKVMGAAQRIFYFHVPTAMVTYSSVLVLLAGSIGYLWTRNTMWDNLSRAATETGLLFCSLVLITGPIWAKPAWGTWWTWEARLISTLVLEILLIAALMVRRYADNRDLGARLAAIIGITIAADVYVVHKAVEWWRGMHPEVFKAGNRGSLDPRMTTALFVCMGALFFLCITLIRLRYRAARIETRSEALRLERLD